jgi:hypothetical protein
LRVMGTVVITRISWMSSIAGVFWQVIWLRVFTVLIRAGWGRRGRIVQRRDCIHSKMRRSKHLLQQGEQMSEGGSFSLLGSWFFSLPPVVQARQRLFVQ